MPRSAKDTKYADGSLHGGNANFAGVLLTDHCTGQSDRGAIADGPYSSWAGNANNTQASVATTTGTATALTTYGDIVTVTAIVGTGNRFGVDMVWPNAAYGHFGIDLTGPSGGLVRVDDIAIEDASAIYLADLVATVDVRDFGAIGNGTADDTAAFEAADAAANGREILVPDGIYRLGSDVTIKNHIKFLVRVSQAQQHHLVLQSAYH